MQCIKSTLFSTDNDKLKQLVFLLSVSIFTDQTKRASSLLVSFSINDEVLSEAAPLFNMSSRDGLCPGPQAAYITYHDASLFVDPSLRENNSRLASSVQLAQVGTTEITNLSKPIRATFLVKQNSSLGVRVASGRMRVICLINMPLQQQRPLDRVSTFTYKCIY